MLLDNHVCCWREDVCVYYIIIITVVAERPEDPFSGNVCLPGGHECTADADDKDEMNERLVCAMREAREEVGLDLHDGAYMWWW